MYETKENATYGKTTNAFRFEADCVASDKRDKKRAPKRQRREETATPKQVEMDQCALLAASRRTKAAASKLLAKEAKELVIKLGPEKEDTLLSSQTGI